MFRTDGGYGVPGMPGNAGQFLASRLPSPGGSPYSQLPREYLEKRYPFGQQPNPTPPPPQPPQPPVQLKLPLANSSNLPNALPGAPGNFGGFSIAAEYPTDRWNKDDQILLDSLKRGELGKGPQIDKAIIDLTRQRSTAMLFRDV
jgi:hypothetical protein